MTNFQAIAGHVDYQKLPRIFVVLQVAVVQEFAACDNFALLFARSAPQSEVVNTNVGSKVAG